MPGPFSVAVAERDRLRIINVKSVIAAIANLLSLVISIDLSDVLWVVEVLIRTTHCQKLASRPLRWWS